MSEEHLKELNEEELALFDELCARPMPGNTLRVMRNNFSGLLLLNVLIAGTTAGLFARSDELQLILLGTAPFLALMLALTCGGHAEAAARRIRELLLDVGLRYKDFDPAGLPDYEAHADAATLAVRLHDPRCPILTIYRACCRFVLVEAMERRKITRVRNIGLAIVLLLTAAMFGIALGSEPSAMQEFAVRALYTIAGMGYALAILIAEGGRRFRYRKRVEIIRKAYRDPALLCAFPDLELPSGAAGLRA